jgi:hypothetical protein
MSQSSNLFLSIGKPVKDEYGRVIGKIASFALTPNGKFDSVFVEMGNGRFSKYPTEHLKFDGSDTIFVSTNKLRAASLCDQIPLIWRKDQALKDLAEKKKISQELYQDLHNNFDVVLNQLKKDAQALLEVVAKEIARCEEEIKALNYALAHLEIEHEIGKVDEQYYKSAFAMLQENLKRVNMEKSDMELTKNKLSNILLGETPKVAEPEANKPLKGPTLAAPELPEPPVVVYVKEIGKAGI